MNKIYLIGLSICLAACSQSKVQPTKQIHSVNDRNYSDIPKSNKIIAHKEKNVPVTYSVWASMPDHQQQIQAYKGYLQQQGLSTRVPDFEFFQTARDWQKCNDAEYEVPPRELWPNIVPTLNILNQFIEQKLIDQFTVTSVYRNYHLNQCAGGAGASKHVFNAALDFRIGSENPDPIEQINIEHVKAKLCQFWRDQGEALNMGLGVYASGQIHIDASGYRTWGVDHRYSSSPCIKDSLASNLITSLQQQ
ncbi:D-Ala-D-Ala carboxypeptidase family metallohydrolase [Acinetobacter sp. NIPH 2699]|uniref:D-Ala-D-Ala carboxypeptidase family metallohydrolase n=1 Tax=Acinetobacter sp. NIPH 2699 TaxID=2923433 RepID=UPI001F4B0340|nr:D-Ala-D-Ala carboxypeptidase family metallohydrolase [Acinetobacter sp. NIPH 2699]MCH7337168.1 D-Ala-D-Ala carboxypeptidase family metallohydrolase [Acinetobacter sp. NIPH 2699]